MSKRARALSFLKNGLGQAKSGMGQVKHFVMEKTGLLTTSEDPVKQGQTERVASYSHPPFYFLAQGRQREARRRSPEASGSLRQP